jgi:isoquinoline 1-oxidoreductase alpha subunit/nicotinate dehydrogenase subunit A
MVRLEVNGVWREVEVDPSTPLVFGLRNTLGLTGTKLGCGLEQCGACAVLVDGVAKLSCVEPVGAFAGCSIRTAEGLGDEPATRAVQAAFVEAGAAQCGYCIPGMTVAVAALLAREARLDEAAIREALVPHLCRCGTHSRVLAAVRRLAGGGPR